MRAVDRNARPGEVKESHQDLLSDTWLQSKDVRQGESLLLSLHTPLKAQHVNFSSR